MTNDDIKLAPGKPNECPGNGEHGIECQCDECDYLMLCAEQMQPADEELTSANTHYKKLKTEVERSADDTTRH